MNKNFLIDRLNFILPDVYLLKLMPTSGDEIFDFLPGQFVGLTNPQSLNSKKKHFFSIASSPNNKSYLELCVKIYGNWTYQLAKKKTGDLLEVSGPFGQFIWRNHIQKAVFLAGGIGITPFMSMLRYLTEIQKSIEINLLYGSRTPATIVYKNEIEEICKTLATLKVVHILSDIADNHKWTGYRGFITESIIRNEVKDFRNATFFICGPPVFVTYMDKILSKLSINPDDINKELFTNS